MDQQEQHKHFFDVEMPPWYRYGALALRILCLLAIVAVVVWRNVFGIREAHVAAFVVIGIAVVAMLPSIPKAWIEQRNRLRGLKDGSLDRYLKNANNKNSS
jgi:hypothetical protein